MSEEDDFVRKYIGENIHLYKEERKRLDKFRRLLDKKNLSIKDLRTVLDGFEELIAQGAVITRVSDRLQKMLDNKNMEIIEKDDLLQKLSEEIKTNQKFKIRIKPELKRALKQYLTFFSEFVLMAKGKRINFEVSSYQEGLQIEIDHNEDIYTLNKYLNEYLGFLQIDIDSIESNLNDESTISQDILLIHLKNQLRMVKTDLELEKVKSKQLEQSVGTFKDILLADRHAPIHISLTSDTNFQNVTEIHINQEMKLEIEKVVDQLENLAKASSYKIPEIDGIQMNLMKIKNEKNPRNAKKFYNNVVRYLKNLNEVGTESNKVLNSFQNGMNMIKSIGSQISQIASDLNFDLV